MAGKFICLALLFLLSGAAMAQPQQQSAVSNVQSSLNQGLDRLESLFFHHTYSQDTTDARLQRLEQFVFAAVQTGSPEERLNKLCATAPKSTSTSPTIDALSTPVANTPVTEPSAPIVNGDAGLYSGRYVYLDAPSFVRGTDFYGTPEVVPETMFVTNSKIAWQASPQQLFPGQYLYLGTSSLPATARFKIDGTKPAYISGIPIVEHTKTDLSSLLNLLVLIVPSKTYC